MKLHLLLCAFILGGAAEQENLDVTPGPLPKILEQPKIVNNDMDLRLFAKPVSQGTVEASPKVAGQKSDLPGASFQISLLPSTGGNPQVPAAASHTPLAQVPSLVELVPKVVLPEILRKSNQLQVQCLKPRSGLAAPPDLSLELRPATSELTIPEFILLKLLPKLGKFIIALLNLPGIKNAILDFLPALLKVAKYVWQLLVRFVSRFIPPKLLNIIRTVLLAFKLPSWIFSAGLNNGGGGLAKRIGDVSLPHRIVNWVEGKLFGRNKLIPKKPLVVLNEGQSTTASTPKPPSGLKSNWLQMDWKNRLDDASYMVIPRSKSLLPNLGLRIAYTVPQYGAESYGYNPQVPIYSPLQYQQGVTPQAIGGDTNYRAPNGMYFGGFGRKKGYTFWY